MIKNLYKSLFNKKGAILETNRLILRPWKKSDLNDLFMYAQDERIGPPAGWLPHKTKNDSAIYLEYNRKRPYTYAIVPKSLNRAVGSITLMRGIDSNLEIPKSEAEIGYWLGHPYWGNGLVPEATRELIRFGFEELNLNRIWCGYFDGNENSKKVQSKCGFKYHHTERNIYWAATNEFKTEHITVLEKDEYQSLKRNGKI